MNEDTLQRCANGEEDAWEVLIRAHQRRVFNMCYRFTQSNSDAQDLTQEVFLRVFLSVATFRASGGKTTTAFQTWVARLTRNLLIDDYRQKKLDRLTEPLEPRLAMLKEKAAECSGPDGVLAARDFQDRLHVEIRRLPPGLRQTLVLRELEEMEYSQISLVLGVPEGTVKSRLNRARAVLARRKNLLTRQSESDITKADYVGKSFRASTPLARHSAHSDGAGGGGTSRVRDYAGGFKAIQRGL